MRRLGLDLNRVHCIDCPEGMRLLEDGYVDVIVTLTPYNIGIRHEHPRDDMVRGGGVTPSGSNRVLV